VTNYSFISHRLRINRKRHIRNLKALKSGDVIAHDVEAGQCHNVEQEFGIKTYSTLEEALAQEPDVALICNPTSLHIPASYGRGPGKACHLFVENLYHTHWMVSMS